MSALFWYKLLFMTELIIAEGLFTFRLKKRSYFILRLLGSLAVCYIATIFYPLGTGYAYPWWYISLMFFALFFITFFLLLFLYRITISGALFFALTAYTLQHITHEIFTLIVTFAEIGGDIDMYSPGILDFSNITTGTLVFCLIYVDIYILTYAAAYLILGRRINKQDDIKIRSLMLLWFGALILLIDIVINSIVVYSMEDNRDYELVVCSYNIICCILVFYIQMSLVSAKDMKREISQMTEILHQSQRQYMLQKENIDLINTKCHDLRHRMRTLASDGRLADEELSEINEAISIYDAKVSTGNEVLDIILTEKSLICREKGVNMTCLADGSALSFIREGDLYALFGNMVENAIEAAAELEEKDKRCVSLNVTVVGELVSITASNYFTGNIKFSENGLPVTKKGDANYHGFGMRSIEMVVKRYGGSLSIVTKDDLFRLNVLLPRKNVKQ